MKPSRDARDRTLGMRSLWDLARKFVWELHLVDAIPNRVRVGVQPGSPLEFRDAALYGMINAAMTSLAMLDWLAILSEDPEYGPRLRSVYPTLEGKDRKRLKREMRELVPMLQMCHQIGNAFKHREISDYDTQIKLHANEVVFDELDGSQWISYGVLVFAGLPANFSKLDEVLCHHCDWWISLLRKLGLPED